MKECRNCKSNFSDDMEYCNRCGQQLSSVAVGKDITKFILIGLSIIALLYGGWYVKDRNETRQYFESIREPLTTVFAVGGKLSSIGSALGGDPRVMIKEIDAMKEQLGKAKQEIEKKPVANRTSKNIQLLATRISDLLMAYADKVRANIPEFFAMINKLEEDKRKIPVGKSNTLDNMQYYLISGDYRKSVGLSGAFPLQMELKSILGDDEYSKLIK